MTTPASAQQIRNASQGLLNARIVLAAAETAFQAQEVVIDQATQTEANALADAQIAYAIAVDQARAANPAWATAKAARDQAMDDVGTLTAQLSDLQFDGS